MGLDELLDIIAFEVGDEIVCTECIKLDDPIVGKFVQDDRYREELPIICDRCEEWC